MNEEAMDRRAWSGTIYHIYCELQKYYKVDLLNVKVDFTLRRILYIIKRLICKKNSRPEHTLKTGKVASGQLKRYLTDNSGKYDMVFLTVGALAYEKLDIPIIYLTDSVFSQMIDYYWFKTFKRNIVEGNELQKKALENANKVILTSEWAKNAAINDYQIDGEKIEIVHFGASVAVTKKQEKEHENINLLFVGVEYQRKGGKTAIECVKRLNQMDEEHKYILHFVGCEIPKKDKAIVKDGSVRTYGFLNKNHPHDREQIESLYEIADFFLLPTLAECSAIVCCEASAYSLPIITYDTGGLGDYVVNGKNGYRLPLTATANDFAEKIISIVQNSDELKSLKKNAWNMYLTDLNWKTFGEKLHAIIGKVTL